MFFKTKGILMDIESDNAKVKNASQFSSLDFEVNVHLPFKIVINRNAVRNINGD